MVQAVAPGLVLYAVPQPGPSQKPSPPAPVVPYTMPLGANYLRYGDFTVVNSRFFGNSKALIRPPAARCNFTDKPAMQNIVVLVLRTMRHVPEQPGSLQELLSWGEKRTNGPEYVGEES